MNALLPFAVSPDFLDSCRDYLIEEEGMDPKNTEALDEAMMEMAREMCEMALSDEDEEVDREIIESLLEEAQPYIDEQIKWEEKFEQEGGSAEELPSAASSFASGELPLPDGVNPEALRQFEEWEAETASTTGGPLGSLGWSYERGGLHPAIATLVVGVNGWRIGPKVDPILQMLAGNIEAFWRQLFPGDLRTTTMDPRWKLVDSCDFNHSGMAWDKVDPEQGDACYPRMVLENRCYQTDVFRNLHLELVLRQDGLQVMHCVMWPRNEYELPILGLDVVVSPSGDMQYVIADPSPVTADMQLPPAYVDAVRMLRAQFVAAFATPGVPEWGRDIFSDEVVTARPATELEGELFVMYALALMRVHILYAKRAQPVTEAELLADIDSSHRRYCENQRANAKTRAVLGKSFKHLGADGDLFVERYMREVLFDYEFHYDISDETKQQLRQENSDKGHPQMQGDAMAQAATSAMPTMHRGYEDAEAQRQSGGNKQ